MPICDRFLPFFVREWAGVCVWWSKLNDLWTIKKIFRRCSDDQIGIDRPKIGVLKVPIFKFYQIKVVHHFLTSQGRP